ncbi:SDR family NAD(P)-dependent oxidoreductase [Microbacterium xylanilyticum]
MSAVIVVTGAASGIGAAVRRQALSHGDIVLALDQLPPREDGEPGTFWEQCDVTDRNAVEGALLSGFERIGKPPAALVHCAGIYLTSPSETADLSVWERVLAVNATGSFQLASLVGRHMLAAGSGSIVLLSSIAWALGDNTEPSAAYAASKGAVVSLGRQLATEWGPRGVRTNVVVPGVIDTGMTTIIKDEAGFRSAVGSIPLGRIGTADEVAHVCRFLASTDASFVNGAVIPVDGGQLVM